MGLKLGRILGKGLRSIVKRAPAIVGGFAMGGPLGAGLALIRPSPSRFAPVGAGVPSIQAITGVPSFIQDPVVQGEGLPIPTAAGAVPMIVRGMTIAVARAIGRLGLALGIPVTLGNLGRIGMRLWTTVTSFARRHPGLSIVSFLVSLGLSIEEASEFLMWGQLKKKRRRGRGISARDIRVARRTIRKVAAFQRDLVGLHRHPRGRARGRDGVVVARAG